MPVAIACQCGSRFSAKDELRGKTVSCPTCKRPLVIPAATVARPQPIPTLTPIPAVAAQPVMVACRCGQRFKAAPHLFGKTVNCPACRSPLTIPVPTAQRAVLAVPVDPLGGPLGSTQLDNDPFGVGMLNTAMPAATFPSASLPQSGSYSLPRPATVAPVKRKKAGGGSGKVWAITGSGIGAALVVVLVLLRFGGIVARAMRQANFGVSSRNVEWVSYTSPSGDYSVEIVKQTPGVVIPGFAGKIGANGVIAAVSKQGPCTAVEAQKLPLVLNDAQLALARSTWENFVRTEITKEGATITRSSASTLGGLPAQELVIENAEEDGSSSIVQVRAAFLHDRGYVLGYMAIKPIFRQSDANRFFNSFRLTNAGTSPTTTTASPTSQVSNEDYSAARKKFRTKLTRQGPAPQSNDPVQPSPGTTLIQYQSQELALRAVASEPRNDGVKRPGLLYLHGGFGYGSEDWEQARPFVNAGYVVMIPTLRGENGQPGNHTMFYDELDDVLAAAEALAQHPDVDTRNLFVAGHSAGGILAAMAALATNKFRASAAYSGVLDMRAVRGSGTNQTDFTFLNGWHNLVTLDLFANHLTNFVLPGGLTNLKVLILRGNSLSSLIVPTNLTALTSLDVAENRLTELNLPGTLGAI